MVVHGSDLLEFMAIALLVNTKYIDPKGGPRTLNIHCSPSFSLFPSPLLLLMSSNQLNILDLSLLFLRLTSNCCGLVTTFCLSLLMFFVLTISISRVSVQGELMNASSFSFLDPTAPLSLSSTWYILMLILGYLFLAGELQKVRGIEE